MGRTQGITEQQITDLAHFETSPAFSDTERLVLRYAVGMTQTPVEVPDDLFAALQNAFTAPQLVELTSAIARENFRARFYHAFDLRAEGFSEGAVCAVPVRVPAGHPSHR